MLLTLGLALSIALAGSATSALLLRTLVQRRNAARIPIPDGGVDEAGWVTLGGLEQWVTVRGHDRAAPVLLFVHGGPGSTMSLMSYRMLAPWERRFTVVNWDQRGAGRTFGRHGQSGSGALTLEQMTADGLELAEHLLKRLGKRQIILLGHSWGSILGVEMIRRRPDLFCAYVGAGQVIDMARGEAVSYAGALARLRAKGDEAGAATLERVGPPPYAGQEQLYTQRRLLISTMPQAERRVFKDRPLTLLLSPSGELRDITDFFNGFAYSLGQLWGPLMAWRIDREATDFAVPVFFFIGDQDLQSPAELVTAYAPTVRAPTSALVTFPGAAHFAFATHGEAFLHELVTRVRPLGEPV